MIIASIADSFLEHCPPGDSMLGDLACIFLIWSEVIVVLIDDDDPCRFSGTISFDLEKYRDMLASSRCERVVRLAIEAGDHHPTILRDILARRCERKVYERTPWLPLT
jgi:hypothetical protein